jgi:hypothetical protein
MAARWVLRTAKRPPRAESGVGGCSGEVASGGVGGARAEGGGPGRGGNKMASMALGMMRNPVERGPSKGVLASISNISYWIGCRVSGR